MPDLSDFARTAVAVAFFGAQAALVLTGSQRSEGAFAFRMFNQSSVLSVSLSREILVNGEPHVVPVKGGEWVAKDRYGTVRRFSWADRVKASELRAFDHRIHASYGVEAQVSRFHAALNDVASHLEDDTETRALRLDIAYSRNGHEEVHQHFEARTIK